VGNQEYRALPGLRHWDQPLSASLAQEPRAPWRPSEPCLRQRQRRDPYPQPQGSSPRRRRKVISPRQRPSRATCCGANRPPCEKGLEAAAAIPEDVLSANQTAIAQTLSIEEVEPAVQVRQTRIQLDATRWEEASRKKGKSGEVKMHRKRINQFEEG